LGSLEDVYASKTIEKRVGAVFSVLKDHRKETGVDEPSKLVKLPKVQTVKAKAYSKDELQKLFGAMNETEYGATCSSFIPLAANKKCNLPLGHLG
jgi:hypothetical protein